jgi:hypothetical protein
MLSFFLDGLKPPTSSTIEATKFPTKKTILELELGKNARSMGIATCFNCPFPHIVEESRNTIPYPY